MTQPLRLQMFSSDFGNFSEEIYRNAKWRARARCCKSRQGKFMLWERHYTEKVNAFNVCSAMDVVQTSKSPSGTHGVGSRLAVLLMPKNI